MFPIRIIGLRFNILLNKVCLKFCNPRMIITEPNIGIIEINEGCLNLSLKKINEKNNKENPKIINKFEYVLLNFNLFLPVKKAKIEPLKNSHNLEIEL
ncbi:MAG: hypothetical protein MRY23_06220 [Pelagibacteraceae bacterium]|nr:hypothetical protein [Pelagibacteraceae bacterium]MCI5078827.1 hypothetical protein [Pelagibacteraceae bacterium]